MPRPAILTQKQARAAQTLQFCYLCGEPFDVTSGRENHPDHIPPKELFAKQDHDFPIKVAAHESCNNQLSDKDEGIGQLVAVSHGKYAKLSRLRLDFKMVEDQATGEEFIGVSKVHVEDQVIRWVRGFHAALYEEFLTGDRNRFCVSLPFPRLLTGPHAKSVNDGLLRNHISFVEEIKKNRVAGRLDRIESNNGQCVYECVWTNMDDGQPACIFALKLYDWSRLADPRLDRRSCVGLYLPITGRPALGAEATTLEMPISRADILDAFAG
jgi:hypothetical protein